MQIIVAQQDLVSIGKYKPPRKELVYNSEYLRLDHACMYVYYDNSELALIHLPESDEYEESPSSL